VRVYIFYKEKKLVANRSYDSVEFTNLYLTLKQ